jgi:ribosomal protein S18 acetylase RimI-like enzyme
MRSPVYNPNFDLVTVAPDGQFASFCIIWPDPVNHIGLFEPVGTHSDFQRQGLGRAVVTEGLHRLKSWGMNRAMVCAEHNNPGAFQLYEAVGFEAKHKLHTFVKRV